MDDAEAQRRAEAEELQKRAALAIARIDALGAAPATADAAAQLDEAEAAWQALVARIDQDASERFTSRLAIARAAVDAHAKAEAERQAEIERAAARAGGVCRAVRSRRGAPRRRHAGRDREIARRVGRDAGRNGAGAAGRRAAHRFDAACRVAAERHANRQDLERTHARLAELAAEAERLTTAGPAEPAAEGGTPVDTEAAWQTVAGEWHGLIGRADGLDADVTARFAEAEARVTQRAEAKRLAAERTLRQQAQRIEQLLDRVAGARRGRRPGAARGRPRRSRSQGGDRAPPALPAREQQALVERLKAAMTTMAPRLHDLREMDEWKRFANAAVQEELIAKAEALHAKYNIGSTDPEKPEEIEKAAHELHELQERWKQVAEAPRAQAQSLWHRYRQAADPIQAKAREFFAQRAGERDANLRLKLALIERAEALAESTDWIKTADELKKLQAEWQQVGPIPRQESKTTWKRFRDACDRFFTRRNDGPQPAQGSLVGEPRQEGSAV